MRSRIDSIRYAASLVLAGCAPSNPTTPVDTTRKVTPPDPSVLVVIDPEPPDVPPPNPGPKEVAPPAPPPPNGYAGNAQQACQNYRDRIADTADDPRRMGIQATKSSSPYGYGGPGPRGPSVTAQPASDGTVRCTIVWETKTVTTTVMHHPTCCPMAGPRQPCPQPSPRQTQGTDVLTEQVTLGDGPPQRKVGRAVFTRQEPRHACGRRPEGFAIEASSSASVGDVLATMAALEAASVSAFHRLAEELQAHGAPASLVERARTAMQDEVRHARALRRLARDRGGRPVKWRRDALPVRSRLALGLENATEGCVSEAFGAATALVQAERAQDPELREAFAVIAREELEHAALAWDVHAWLVQTGTTEERAALDRALHEAVDQVGHTDPGVATREALGLPDPATSQIMLGLMAEQLGIAA